MENEIHFTLKQETIEDLQAFGEILRKDTSTMLEEALKLYFETEQKKLVEKDIDKENALTNLDYDEFWEGVDI